ARLSPCSRCSRRCVFCGTSLVHQRSTAMKNPVPPYKSGRRRRRRSWESGIRPGLEARVSLFSVRVRIALLPLCLNLLIGLESSLDSRIAQPLVVGVALDAPFFVALGAADLVVAFEGEQSNGEDQGDQQSPHPDPGGRSEEHTSELQSRENLVCRLLLEKKKKKSRDKR